MSDTKLLTDFIDGLQGRITAQPQALAEALLAYMAELKSWNEKFNLTSITDEKEIIVKHFIDSLYPLRLDLLGSCKKIADAGTGAGLPGVALAAALPGTQVTLIDSNGKKIGFLKHVKQALKLDNIVVLQERTEVISNKQPYREKFDAVTVRALSDYKIAREVCAGLVKQGGKLIYYASAKQAEALKGAVMKNNRNLGLGEEELTPYSLPESAGERAIVSVKKLWKTFDGYPRTYGKIKARPLE